MKKTIDGTCALYRYAKTKQTIASDVRVGDCVVALEKLADRGIKYDLLLGDPPYNQKVIYDACHDNLGYDEYMAWTKQWIAAADGVLSKRASMWIFAPEEWDSEIDILCRKEFGWHKRRKVIWSFTFGQAAQNNFTKSYCTLLYFTKAETKFTFNSDAVRVPSARQLIYKDPRSNPKGKCPDANWMLLKEQLEPYMGKDKDAWLENRICGTYRERHAHSPNQIPLPIMDRIIKSCSNPGDLVLDLFCGTGSAGVAAATLGRNYLGFDLSKTCVTETRKRIAAAMAT